MTDRDQAALEDDGAAARGLRRGLSRLDRIGGRVQRRTGHQVQQVHQEQLLMLLVVVQAQLEKIALKTARRARCQPGGHAAVDLAPIGQDLVHRRTGDQAAPGARHPLAQGLVVGVEQLLEARIDRLIIRVGRQDHGLEKPAGVGQVPFAGAAVGHGLGRQVLGRQAFRQGGHCGPDFPETGHVGRRPRIGLEARIHVSRPPLSQDPGGPSSDLENVKSRRRFPETWSP